MSIIGFLCGTIYNIDCNARYIPLEWYEACIETNGSEDIKHFKTSNRNSCRNRKVPVTRTKDFLWPI